MNITDGIQLIDIEALAPSKLNPRQHFDADHIKRLAASLAKDGLLENLIVRPQWCVGIDTEKALVAREPQQGTDEFFTANLPFEIVSGECRWRAAKLAGLKELSCRVRLLTDPELEELNLIEQMHRNELTPLEEARSFARLLAYRNEDGTPRHSHESLAAAISMSLDVIYNRLQLLKLPEVATKALVDGRLGMTIASRIARIPDKAMAETATKAIMKGGTDGEPMSYRQAEAYIAENCMKELKGAPFDIEDETLVKDRPEFSPHTSCTKCPFRTGNNKALFGDVKRGDVCTRPACFKAKVEAAYARQAATATSEGCVVLSEQENSQAFPDFANAGDLAFNSPYARLDDEPAAHLLKPVVKNAPTWGQLVTKLEKAEMRPTVYLAKDQAGNAVKLVKMEQIIAGAEKAGEPVFREKSGPRREPNADDTKMRAENKRLAAEAALKEKVMIEALCSVHTSLWTTANMGVWELFLAIQLEGDPASRPGWRLPMKMLKVSDSAGLRAAVAKMPLNAQNALVPLLLIGQALLENGMEVEAFKGLAKLVKVDLRALEKSVRAEAAKATKKAPPAAPRSAGKTRKTKRMPERTVGTNVVKEHLAKKRGAVAKALAAVKGSMKPKAAKKGGAS